MFYKDHFFFNFMFNLILCVVSFNKIYNSISLCSVVSFIKPLGPLCDYVFKFTKRNIYLNILYKCIMYIIKELIRKLLLSQRCTFT